MILQRTAEFFHAASALSCRSGLDNDMRLKCRDGSEGGRHHHRLTSYDQPVRLDIIGITCRHPRPTGSSPCVDSSESCSTAQAARIYWDPPLRRYDVPLGGRTQWVSLSAATKRISTAVKRRVPVDACRRWTAPPAKNEPFLMVLDTNRLQQAVEQLSVLRRVNAG